LSETSIEFRLRRSDDSFEPFYVRIAEASDGEPLAFTENDEDAAVSDAAIDTLRGGGIGSDTLYDRRNDVWFFRLKDANGEVIFRSMPCASEQAMQDTIARILREAPDAPVVDDRG
jgi:uncharacterized protein YegP (UPF0339 family)